jgi:hypothetical protein
VDANVAKNNATKIAKEKAKETARLQKEEKRRKRRAKKRVKKEKGAQPTHSDIGSFFSFVFKCFVFVGS